MYDELKKRFCCEYNITSKETVLNNYIIPYLKEEPFFIDGVELTKNKISKIHISQTEHGIESEVEKFRAIHKGSGIIVLATKESVAQDDTLVKNVTNEIIKEAKNQMNISFVPSSNFNTKMNNNKIFVVYGHDEVLQLKVTAFIKQIGIEPVLLSDKPNKGQTIIEKLEANSDVSFAIILFSPDDDVTNGQDNYKQPRPNVLFEYGYFMAKLGRNRLALLVKDEIKILSDIMGTGYIKIQDNDGWEIQLAKELRAAGYEVDMNKVI